jgi:leucyl/phenylalanyl-tRNA--protein transferase
LAEAIEEITVVSVKQFARPLAYRLVSLILRQGAQLTPERMIAEYRQGRFPMAVRFGRITWHDPSPRAIMPLDDRFHVPRNVRKIVRSQHFEISFDRAFREVIAACAITGPRRTTTWLSPELIDAYTRLHKRGYAHSVEVWRDGRLVGGGYGVTIGGFYAGESMFTRENHASKVALVAQIERLRERGFILCDSQILNDHTRQFGAIEISRAEYDTLLAQALATDAHY